MPEQSIPSGELEYYDRIGEGGRRHALRKPFSDHDAGPLLGQVGALLAVLPPPPARILDCGCGPGWLAKLLAQCGYEVVGLDVAPAAIELAKSDPIYTSSEHVSFLVSGAETHEFQSEFDAVVFFDALHHVQDELAAIEAAHRALRPGGRLITSEPGRGHHDASEGTIDAFGVTERDMPAHHIRDLARMVGFTAVQVLPRTDDFIRIAYETPPVGLTGRLRTLAAIRSLRLVRRFQTSRLDNGIVVATRS